MSSIRGPSEREVKSNVDAFKEKPWGEVLDYASTYDFLSSFYDDSDGFVAHCRANPESRPYLYVHTYNYHDDFASLADGEFTGINAHYRAKDEELITGILQNCGSITYLASAHADRKVKIPIELKPRLKVFPGMIEKIFEVNGSDSIVGYTHDNTGMPTPVLDAVNALKTIGYDVQTEPYDIEPKTEGINDNHIIDKLTLFTISRA